MPHLPSKKSASKSAKKKVKVSGRTPPLALLDLVYGFLRDHKYLKAAEHLRTTGQPETGHDAEDWANASAGLPGLVNIFKQWRNGHPSEDVKVGSAHETQGILPATLKNEISGAKSLKRKASEMVETSSDSESTISSSEPESSSGSEALEAHTGSRAGSDSESSSDSEATGPPATKKRKIGEALSTSKQGHGKLRTMKKAGSDSSSTSSSNSSSSAVSSDSESDEVEGESSSSSDAESSSEDGSSADESEEVANAGKDAGADPDSDTSATLPLPGSGRSRSESADTSSSSDSDQEENNGAGGAPKVPAGLSTKQAAAGARDKTLKTAAAQPSAAVPPTSASAAATAKKARTEKVTPFSRIPDDIAVDPRFASNAYRPYDYADRAHQDLIVTKGKGFTKEKNKKKRGSYRGGAIDTSGGKGIKFDD